MPWFIFAALGLLLLAVLVFWMAARKQRAAGMPGGRVIAADMGSWKRMEKPLYDPRTGLAGRPDYIIVRGGTLIPVEVKSGWAPGEPHDSHLFQLAAYCYLIECSTGSRPPYGILHYRNRTFAVDYTRPLESELLSLLDGMHAQQRRGEQARSHDEPARCARCGFRSQCDQRLG